MALVVKNLPANAGDKEALLSASSSTAGPIGSCLACHCTKGTGADLLQGHTSHEFRVVFSIKNPFSHDAPHITGKTGKTERAMSVLQVLKLRIKDQADLPRVSW